MKIGLELNIVERTDGREDIYLNFWDNKMGRDVVCQLIDNKLRLLDFDHDDHNGEEITIGTFIDMVKERTNER